MKIAGWRLKITLGVVHLQLYWDLTETQPVLMPRLCSSLLYGGSVLCHAYDFVVENERWRHYLHKVQNYMHGC